MCILLLIGAFEVDDLNGELEPEMHRVLQTGYFPVGRPPSLGGQRWGYTRGLVQVVF